MAITDNVTPSGQDAMSMQLIFVGRALNFQSTADQALSRLFTGTNAVATHIIAVEKSGSGSVTCVGGIYTAASKGGNAIVAATQSWVTLASGVTVMATLAAIAQTSMTGATLFLSLTTGSTAALTADVFVYGLVLD